MDCYYEKVDNKSAIKYWEDLDEMKTEFNETQVEIARLIGRREQLRFRINKVEWEKQIVDGFLCHVSDSRHGSVNVVDDSITRYAGWHENANDPSKLRITFYDQPNPSAYSKSLAVPRDFISLPNVQAICIDWVLYGKNPFGRNLT